MTRGANAKKLLNLTVDVTGRRTDLAHGTINSVAHLRIPERCNPILKESDSVGYHAWHKPGLGKHFTRHKLAEASAHGANKRRFPPALRPRPLGVSTIIDGSEIHYCIPNRVRAVAHLWSGRTSQKLF